MKAKTIAAALLMTLGIIVSSYSDIDAPEKPVGIPGLTMQTVDRHFISPVFGAFALLGGIGLLFVKPRSG